MITRRGILGVGLAMPALAVAHVGESQAQTLTIGAIHVDVSRLKAQGWGSNALGIKLGLERELEAALAGHLRRGAGPTLNVAVRAVFLNSYAGNDGGRWGSGGSTADSFDSEATLVARGNRVLKTWPVLSTVPASSAGPWYLPDIDQRRMDSLIKHNAGWITRYVLG